MSWMQFPRGFWVDPVAKRSPGAPVTCWSFPCELKPVSARWSTTLAATASVAVDRLELCSRTRCSKATVPMDATPGKSRQSGQSNGPGVQLHLVQLVRLATRKVRSNLR
jgi:hypothetical protein